jgi:hypothetical protein
MGFDKGKLNVSINVSPALQECISLYLPASP